MFKRRDCRPAPETILDSKDPKPEENAHPDDDELERFVLGMVRDEATLSWVLQHRLSCQSCRERLEGVQEYVNTMREALTLENGLGHETKSLEQLH